MADMAFYKIIEEKDGVTTVQYRRVEERGKRVTNFFPDRMQGNVIFHGPCNEKRIQDHARQCGWVLNAPRNSDDEIASVVLRGRW